MKIKPEMPIFNRLLIRLNSDYFSLPPQEQEHFRQHLSDAQQTKVAIFLLEALFGIKTETEQQSDSAWEQLDNEQKNLYNAYTTLLRGVGENAFYLNELFAEGRSLQDFKTLYDYDLDDFNFQQQVRKEEAEKEGASPYQIKPYRLYLSHRWGRFIDDGCFYYSTISSLSFYLHGEVEAFINEQIDSLIPHTYKEGRHHGKRDEGGVRWDMRVDANGLEGQLDELRSRCYRYEAALIDNMDEHYHRQTSSGVYVLPQNIYGDPHIDVVVQNADAAKRIHFQRFLHDCRALQLSNEELEGLVANAKQEADCFLREQYQDVMANFDSKVSKLIRRRKVIIAPGMHDDLDI